jgi:hypothetical protein
MHAASFTQLNNLHLTDITSKYGGIQGTIDHCGRGARAKKAHHLYIYSFMGAYSSIVG